MNEETRSHKKQLEHSEPTFFGLASGSPGWLKDDPSRSLFQGLWPAGRGAPRPVLQAG